MNIFKGNWKSFENAAQHVFYSVYNSSVMMCNFQMEFKCFGHVNKKRNENNKKNTETCNNEKLLFVNVLPEHRK